MEINKGDWVTNNTQIGKVKEIWDDGLLDIVIYSTNGKRIGRTSPVMGGPKNFEPCCEPEGWSAIEHPDFPLKTHVYYLHELVKPLTR